MSDDVVTRRSFFGAVAAGTVMAWVEAHQGEIAAAGRFAAGAKATSRYEVLTAEQAALFDAVTAQLVPSDGTPGAREARVVRFIDRAYFTFWKDQRGEIDTMLKLLAEETSRYAPEAASFAALGDADQIAVLKQLERSQPDAFMGWKAMTVLGMFSHPSYGGNFEKTGWKAIGFEDRFAWTPPFGYYDRG